MDSVMIAAAVGVLFAPYVKKALRDELAEALAEIKRQAAKVKVVRRVKETEEAVVLKARRLAHGNVEVAQDVDKATTASASVFAGIG